MATTDIITTGWIVINLVFGFFSKLYTGIFLCLSFLASFYFTNYNLSTLAKVIAKLNLSSRITLMISYIAVLAFCYVIAFSLGGFFNSVRRGSETEAFVSSVFSGLLYAFFSALIVVHVFNFLDMFYPNTLRELTNTISYSYFLTVQSLF